MSDQYIAAAASALNAAMPASGRPETPEEWAKALKAHEDVGYAILRSGGMGKAQARAMAPEIFVWAGGRAMLELGFAQL